MKITKRFKELKDIDGLSYHAHKRAAHVIQGSVKEKESSSKTLTSFNSFYYICIIN